MTNQKSFLFIFLLWFSCYAGAQNILKGKVIDSKTLEPLAYANVFINFTTIGTSTDDNGEFTLNNIPAGESELIASFVGHQTFQIKLTPAILKNYLQIKLTPVELKEVEITDTKDAVWNKQLKKFETLFLGGKSSHCKILNPWVIDFTEGENNILIAKASAPLEIENLSLGFNVTYILKDFVASGDVYKISGNIYFKPIETLDPKLIKKWRQARLKVYEGSDRHLFKSIINGKAEENGFKIYEDQSKGSQLMRNGYFSADLGKILFPYSTVGKVSPFKESEEFIVKFPARAEVHYFKGLAAVHYYRDIQHPVSWIEVQGGTLRVNKQGVVLNPGNMVVSGYLTESRIGQVLPYDYTPAENIISPLAIEKNSDEKKILKLIEQPYLQTDKPYYYPNDVIWFKCYVNYATPSVKDSLSKVLYVDIIANGKVVQTRMLPLEDGKTNGDLHIGSNAEPGDYFLRAYTRWTCNFGNEYVFTKPIKILKINETIRLSDAPNYNRKSAGVNILTDKNMYAEKEKISLTFNITDSLGNPVTSDLSVSVTDTNQVTPVEDEKNILSSFPIRNSKILKPQYKNDIEYGITYHGRFINNKGKPDKANINFTDEKFGSAFSVTTQNDGQFSLEALQFYDTIRLAAQAKGTNRKIGLVKVNVIEPKEINETLTALSAQVIPMEAGKSYHAYYDFDTTAIELLPEVTIQAKSLEENNSRSAHGHADFSISSEWLRNTKPTNLLMALQSRVPGLQIIAFVDRDGTVKYMIKIGGPATFMGEATRAPLVLINDIPIFLEVTELTQYIMSINPQQVDRIEILKYGGSAAYGVRGGNGVIAIYLKNTSNAPVGPVSKSFDLQNFQMIKLVGYSTSLSFKSPDYSKNNPDAKSDYRSTLYWNPSVTTDQNGVATVSFYSSSQPASYRIVVEGVTWTGQAVRGEKIIKVGGQ